MGSRVTSSRIVAGSIDSISCFMLRSLGGQAEPQNSCPGETGTPEQHSRPAQHVSPLAQLPPCAEQTPPSQAGGGGGAGGGSGGVESGAVRAASVPDDTPPH